MAPGFGLQATGRRLVLQYQVIRARALLGEWKAVDAALGMVPTEAAAKIAYWLTRIRLAAPPHVDAQRRFFGFGALTRRASGTRPMTLRICCAWWSVTLPMS